MLGHLTRITVRAGVWIMSDGAMNRPDPDDVILYVGGPLDGDARTQQR
jgi:hypothetical protein